MKKKVIALVSALLMTMYGTIPSFSIFAEDEGVPPLEEVTSEQFPVL